MKLNRFQLAAGLIATLATYPLQAGSGMLRGDTYVSTANASTNFGSATLINVGNGNSGLVYFDIARAVSGQLTGVVPLTVSPIIGRATLRVYVNKLTTAGTLTVAPALNAWTESTVTSATAPSVGAVTGAAPVTVGAQYVDIDATALVRGWLMLNNDPTSPNYVGGGNFGIFLNSPDGGVMVLDSKEATTTGHSPDLIIDLATDFTGVLRKDLTLSSPGFTSLMSIRLTGTNTAGGRIWYMVRATDGASQIATEQGVIQFSATPNSITCTVNVDDKLHLGTVNSSCTPGFFNPLSQPGVSIFDNVTFSSPAPIVVHEIFYRIENLSGAVVRLEP